MKTPSALRAALLGLVLLPLLPSACRRDPAAPCAALVDAGRFEEALARCAAVYEATGEPRAGVGAARAAYRLGRGDEALAWVGFEPPLAVGDQFGAPAGHSPGDYAFTDGGVDVYVDKFQFIGGGTAFNVAEIDICPVAMGFNQSARPNNIALDFDFTTLGGIVSRVDFKFADLGGLENLAVNGALYVGDISSAPAALGGATVTVSSSPLGPPISGRRGLVSIKGRIKTLRIGGQELWVDQMCAW